MDLKIRQLNGYGNADNFLLEEKEMLVLGR